MLKSAPKPQFNLAEAPTRPRSLWRRFFLFTLWGGWLLLLAAAMLLAYGWTQRYSLMERGAQYVLASNGIDADLTFMSAGKFGLRLKDVTLRDSHNQNVFFTAERIEARYDWREALDGHIDYVKFTQPHITLELDAAGKPIGGWRPPSRGEEREELRFPKDGFHIENGVVNLTTPYGQAAPQIQASVFDMTRFHADVTLPPTDISYQGARVQISGPASVEANGAGYDSLFDLRLLGLNAPSISADDGRLKGQVNLVKQGESWHVSGPADIDLSKVQNKAVSAARLMISGRHNMAVPVTPKDGAQDKGGVTYNGEADMTAVDMSVSDADLAAQLAARISLSGVLEKSPILREFAPQLEQQVSRRLSGQDVTASLSLNYDGEGGHITARAPVQLIKNKQSWTLSPVGDTPLLRIETVEGPVQPAYKAAAKFHFTKPGRLPLRLTNGAADFKFGPSGLGENLSFTGELALPAPWAAGEVSGGTALLAPKTQIRLTRSGGVTDFTADTQFVISGAVPGGHVTNASGEGQLGVSTQNGQSHIRYRPRGGVKFARMDLNSGWILEDVDVRLTEPFNMRGAAAKRVIDLAAADVRARVHDGAERDFQLTLGEASGRGELVVSDDGLSQIWDMRLTGAQIRSENFPISETDVKSPFAQVQVKITPNTPPEFDVRSAKTRISSALVSAAQIAVGAKGTADNLAVDYDAALFVFRDPALPEIPMAGQTRFVSGRWTGESIARLPEDPDTPIDIAFSFEDGIGSADINIAALQFDPKRLQPQNLVAALRGKIGNVKGAVSTSIKLGFGEGRPLTSSGQAVIDNLNFGTLPGPIQGLHASLDFTSMFPLETSGRQTVQLDSFDPGFPLKDGEIEFELLPGAMKIYRAEWPSSGGRIYIEPLTWSFTANENKAVLVLEAIPIQSLIKREDTSKFEMTGAISGRLPITVSGVKVAVEGGKVSVPGGGVIKLNTPETDIAGAQNQGVGTAFDALKNFQYQSLEADINGPLDGLVRLQAIFIGYNEDVYNRQPFEFDLDLEGELFNLIRELNPETQRRRAVSGRLSRQSQP